MGTLSCIFFIGEPAHIKVRVQVLVQIVLKAPESKFNIASNDYQICLIYSASSEIVMQYLVLGLFTNLLIWVGWSFLRWLYLGHWKTKCMFVSWHAPHIGQDG